MAAMDADAMARLEAAGDDSSGTQQQEEGGEQEEVEGEAPPPLPKVPDKVRTGAQAIMRAGLGKGVASDLGLGPEALEREVLSNAVSEAAKGIEAAIYALTPDVDDKAASYRAMARAVSAQATTNAAGFC